MSETYQLVLDPEGRVVDVRKAKGPPGWTKRFPEHGATVHYTGRGVPLHVCYDDPRQTHPADQTFCRKVLAAHERH